jgi:hypothetical protein
MRSVASTCAGILTRPSGWLSSGLAPTDQPVTLLLFTPSRFRRPAWGGARDRCRARRRVAARDEAVHRAGGADHPAPERDAGGAQAGVSSLVLAGVGSARHRRRAFR